MSTITVKDGTTIYYKDWGKGPVIRAGTGESQTTGEPCVLHSTIRATVGRLLSDQDEGMGIEVKDYIACWIEITVDDPSDMDAEGVVLLGTDLQYRLNGRRVTLRKRQD